MNALTGERWLAVINHILCAIIEQCLNQDRRIGQGQHRQTGGGDIGVGQASNTETLRLVRGLTLVVNRYVGASTIAR